MTYDQASLAWRWRQSLRHPGCELSSTARLVLHTIALYLRDKGHGWPSVKEIARAAGLGPSTVYGYLDELETAGYLSRKKRAGRSTLYFPMLPSTVDEAPWEAIRF